jgi:hypothetical protein
MYSELDKKPLAFCCAVAGVVRSHAKMGEFDVVSPNIATLPVNPRYWR